MRMERTYGKGLTGLFDERTGVFRPERLGRTNRITGGAQLGSSMAVTIYEGLTIDATGGAASFLGFIQGLQYEGLVREDSSNIPTTEIPVTNCFAAGYALMESFDTLGFNWETIFDEPGSIKFFDVLVLDPVHILADISVNFE